MRSSINILILLLFTSCLKAQDSSTISSALDKLSDNPLFENAHLAVSLVDIREGEEILSYNSDKLFIPASGLKLITNFSALKQLGKDYKFKTEIYYRGTLKYDGSLDGDIIVISGGDPSLGSYNFKGVSPLEELMASICRSIKKAGITCIEGDIIVDDSFFEYQGPMNSWQWDDIANYYAGGAYSLNLHENLYFLNFDRNKDLNALSELVSIDPPIPYLSFVNKVRVAKSNTGDNAYVFGGPWNHVKELRGTIPQGKSLFKIKGALPDPPYYFAFILKQYLESQEIQVDSIRKKKCSTENLELIKVIHSPTLERIAYMSNIESNNLYAETLFKMLGKHKFNSDKAALSKAAIDQMASEFGLKKNQIKMADGCGLSRRNKMSSSFMSSFLDNMAEILGLENVCKLLPRPGSKGTAKHINIKEDIASNIWIKTGSMSGVQSYSGYIRTKSKNWYSFCLIANDFNKSNSQVRSEFNDFLISIYQEL